MRKEKRKITALFERRVEEILERRRMNKTTPRLQVEGGGKGRKRPFLSS